MRFAHEQFNHSETEPIVNATNATLTHAGVSTLCGYCRTWFAGATKTEHHELIDAHLVCHDGGDWREALTDLPMVRMGGGSDASIS
jgi:hypothetical protein